MEAAKVKTSKFNFMKKFEEAEDRLHDPMGLRQKAIYGFYFCGGFVLLILIIFVIRLF